MTPKSEAATACVLSVGRWAPPSTLHVAFAMTNSMIFHKLQEDVGESDHFVSNRPNLLFLYEKKGQATSVRTASQVPVLVVRVDGAPRRVPVGGLDDHPAAHAAAPALRGLHVHRSFARKMHSAKSP